MEQLTARQVDQIDPATRPLGAKPGCALREFFSPWAGVLQLVVFFVALSAVVRGCLLAKAYSEVDHSLEKLAGIFLVGASYDLITAFYILIPFVIYLTLIPSSWLGQRWHTRLLSIAYFIALSLLLFVSVAEWLFWDEFGARFNFIAVDYLIYTTEVLGNIRESYPLPSILGGIFLLSVIIFAAGRKARIPGGDLYHSDLAGLRRGQRLVAFIPFALASLLFTAFIDGRDVPAFGNSFNQELARNGVYSLFSAFRNNELNYEQFYDKRNTQDVFDRMRTRLASQNAVFVSTNLTDLTRSITHAGPEKRWNVIQITVESLSAEFLGVYGNTQQLTPHLDALANESLFFTNFYATGTRTVRGMEALTLSLPPTPGQSIVRRPNNENLFSVGSVFQRRGYDTAFIYGGYGYFDNMSAFFSGNGYRIVDRASVAGTNVHFANIWGACDEDTLNWSLQQADEAFAKRKPFFQFVMTTSNHRPYTYPEGRIDIPSHTGREGGVKYTDYAIGQFILKAKTKPWFTNTLFVIVADHCAASAGRADLPANRFEIPLLIYNPALVGPMRIGTLCSQIDYAPTLFALLNFSYNSRFFGKDILAMKPDEERAFIASYQKLGLLRRNELAVLEPVREHAVFSYDRASARQESIPDNPALLEDAISYYQAASYLFSNGLQGAL